MARSLGRTLPDPAVRPPPEGRPVTLSFDGKAVPAHDGEPVVAALIAAGKLALARSSKFHRPRGPACLRAACDGCLARVGGVPNVMTCMAPAREGLEVHTQNTLGSREVDLLRVTDWFFPKGLNHHEIFAGVPGVQSIMQGFARRVAGLGRLPSEITPPRDAARRAIDVLVVGGGASGALVAAACAERGREVELLDDALDTGGAAAVLRDPGWRRVETRLAAAAASGRAVVRAATTAAGVFGDDVLVVGPSGAEIVEARAVVLAPGAHDGTLAFEGNDLPGVMSARAGCMLLRHRVLLGERVVVVVPEGGGPFGEAYAESIRARGAACEVTLVRGEPVHAHGNASVKSITVKPVGGAPRELRADAVLVDAPRAPAYELCEQAGAPLVHEPRGFVPRHERGKIRDGFFVVGEAAGLPLDLEKLEAHAHDVVSQIAT